MAEAELHKFFATILSQLEKAAQRSSGLICPRGLSKWPQESGEVRGNREMDAIFVGHIEGYDRRDNPSIFNLLSGRGLKYLRRKGVAGTQSVQASK